MAGVDYDLIIIGAGPGGYVAAIRAAQLGMKVGVVEKRTNLGGTCLNVGCIPSKALLHASDHVAEMGHMQDWGIDAKIKMDIARLLAKKDKIISDLTGGIAFLFKKNKITHLQGAGSISAPGTVNVCDDKGKDTKLTATNIIIATGSEPTPLAGVAVDEDRIATSTGALSFDAVPKHLVVVGAGVIGLELGSVWSRLGAEVTVVEFLDRIVPTLDSGIAKQYMRILKKQGINFKMKYAVSGAKVSGKSVNVALTKRDSDNEETIKCDRLLLAIGRRPYTQDLGLDAIGISLDERGFIPVNDHFATSVDGVYAIGDCILGPMLAHKAEEDGVACVELLAGLAGHVDYNLVPGIIYTNPEVADIGKTEDALKADGVPYKVGSFPISANSRARAAGQSDGLVKIVAHAQTDQILGASIIAKDAGNMIHEIAAVMAFGGAAQDLASICHGHPTLSEAVKEAALSLNSGAIHI